MRLGRFAVAASLLSLGLAGCGGEGSSAPGGGTSSAPAPAPAPSPSPSPAPTPTPTPGSDAGGALLGGLAFPGDLQGNALCSAAPIALTGGRISGVGIGARNVSFLVLYTADGKAYSTDFNGFGGTNFPATSRVSGQAFESFVVAPEELQIAKAPAPLTQATLGLIVNSPALCFYSVAPQAASPPPTNSFAAYAGLVDGLYQSGGGNARLYGGSAAMTFNAGTGKYDVSLTLRTVANAFAEPATQAQVPLGTFTAAMTLTATTRNLPAVAITGPNGLTGTISGSLGGKENRAALLVFDLTSPAGDQLWGVVAADAK